MSVSQLQPEVCQWYPVFTSALTVTGSSYLYAPAPLALSIPFFALIDVLFPEESSPPNLYVFLV